MTSQTTAGKVLNVGYRNIGDEAAGRRTILCAITLLAFCLQFWVVWSVNFPPLHDAANHMARHVIEKEYLFGSGTSEYYKIGYKILPNLGGDVVIPLLLVLFSPIVALKIFASAALIVYWLGPALFIWHHGRYNGASIAASVLLLPLNMAESFFWGFLNYFSGFGLAFLVLVHFEALVRGKRPIAMHVFIHALFVTTLFFWHLAALAIYAVVMACRVAVLLLYGLLDERQPVWRMLTRGVVLSIPMLPSLALYAIWSSTKTASENYWGTWEEKLSLPLHVFRTYSIAADGVVCVLWALAVLAFFGLRWRGNLKTWLWLPAIAFAILTLAVPIQWGSTYHGDARFPPAMLVCLLAIASGLDVRRFALGAALIAVALVMRYGSVYAAWSPLDAQLTAVSKAFMTLPKGSRIMPVVGPNAGYGVRRDWPLSEFAAWTVPLRGAFDPRLYAFPDQQPLSIHRADRIYARFDGRKIIVDDDPTRELFDFVYLYNPMHWPLRISGQFEKIFELGDVSIWRVTHAKSIKGS